MPYTIRKLPGKRCYRVRNARTGQIHAQCTSRQKAEAQVRILRAYDRK